MWGRWRKPWAPALGLGQRARLANPVGVLTLCLAVLATQVGHADGIGPELTLIRDAGFLDSQLGYVVYDLDEHKIVRAHRADQMFIPASITKLATALAALEVLGPDYRFRTRVFARGEKGGVHLHLSGGGDPVLVQEDVDDLAEALVIALAGQPVVRFTYDEAALPFSVQIDPTDDGLRAYNPPISALSVNFNQQGLRWYRDKESRAQRVQLLPNLGDARAGLSGRVPADGRTVLAQDSTRTLYALSPKVASEGQRRIAVRAPALRTAAMLRYYAGKGGLTLPEPVTGPTMAGQGVAVHESQPLLASVRDLLKFSNNLSAELIGLTAARALRPQVANLADSAAAVRGWLADTMPEVVAAGWQVPRQSGLTGNGRATPMAVLALLRYAETRTYPIPVAMQPQQPAATGNGPQALPFLALLREPPWGEKDDRVTVFAKSGTMYYARGQAGVLTGASGRRLLFVLMHTDFAARSAYETHPVRYTAPVQAAARAWLDRARRLERQILLHWVAQF